ncbi:hypothetical protein [Methanobacterium petrolearium]|uniref:hypothetical protein n=1 Tax=Methanobacterium petrolearium TaxID=710190 RepID=UPI001AEB14EC|nr:hypothetical protein [Methanobacterium petrolearium]MBP1946896.1 uncharacterized membrane protein (DUF485 family) [Methanobacterium petrolearium]BDZ72027.1 hypothetical protein GCM10025861_25440 [Methanobacterium petrolearium]
MINTITTYTTTTTYSTSPTLTLIVLVFTVAFLVVVGFIYHLIRNKEYKNTLPASIIIGFVISLLFILGSDMAFDSVSYNLKVIQNTLFFIISVMIGGFVAVSLKKLVYGDKVKESQESSPEKSSKDSEKWWNKQSLRTQSVIILISCLLCLILLIGAVYLFNPVKNSVESKVNLGLSSSSVNEVISMNYTDDAEGFIIIIPNNTTKFSLTGYSEANSTVKITSRDLNLYNQTMPLDLNDPLFEGGIYPFNYK